MFSSSEVAKIVTLLERYYLRPVGSALALRFDLLKEQYILDQVKQTQYEDYFFYFELINSPILTFNSKSDFTTWLNNLTNSDLIKISQNINGAFSISSIQEHILEPHKIFQGPYMIEDQRGSGVLATHPLIYGAKTPDSAIFEKYFFRLKESERSSFILEDQCDLVFLCIKENFKFGLQLIIEHGHLDMERINFAGISYLIYSDKKELLPLINILFDAIINISPTEEKLLSYFPPNTSLDFRIYVKSKFPNFNFENPKFLLALIEEQSFSYNLKTLIRNEIQAFPQVNINLHTETGWTAFSLFAQLHDFDSDFFVEYFLKRANLEYISPSGENILDIVYSNPFISKINKKEATLILYKMGLRSCLKKQRLKSFLRNFILKIRSFLV